VGDALTVIARAGIASVKPLENDQRIVLYALEQDQRYPLVFRGDRPDTLALDAVVPRRIPRDRAAEITISGLGIPRDVERVQVYAGGRALEVLGIASNDTEERIGIITAAVPAMAVAGQYDVSVRVEKDGVWQEATLYGGLMVDAPIRFDSATPDWGPLNGG